MRLGSSPRGRGKHLREDRLAALALGRLIPARAGKTSGWVDPGSNWAAHPRAGGENGRSALPTSFSSGSSPRGRGKRESLVVSSGWGGLIPARAGKTVP